MYEQQRLLHWLFLAKEIACPTNYLLGLPKYLLNGNHYNVDNGNIVDGPSNPFGFIEMSPGFANTEANLKVINY